MRSFLTILALAASAIAMTSFLLSRGEIRPRRPGAPRERVLLPPDRTEILHARGEGVEVLVRARAPREEVAAALDEMLADRLGLERPARFVELWIVNERGERLPLEDWPLRLEDEEGETVAAAPPPGIEGPWAALFADLSPVAPRALRRLVLLLERPVDLARCRGGAFVGLDLQPRLVSVEGLEGFLERPRPPLHVVFDGPERGGRER